jgi:transcriptional antiterminator NusG
MNWYVINITSGYEQKIKNTIESQAEIRELAKKIVVPVIKRKRYLRDKLYFFSEKLFPGYVFVSCNDKDTDVIFSTIANIPGIINMSCIRGARRFYDAVTDEEMYHVLELLTDNKEKIEENNELIKVNMKVKVVDGPFASFQGIVTDINKSHSKETKVKVTTSIFDNGVSTIVIPISFVEPI